MLKLLERAVTSVDQRLKLLAPPDRAIPDTFTFCDFDVNRHSALIAELQRVRGSVYLQDGAIERHQLSSDGRHETPEDDSAWHLLMTNANDEVIACAWYREFRGHARFSQLRLRHCPLALAPEWRDTLWNAVMRDIMTAQSDGLHYAEVGGWAVAPDHRRSVEPLILALATYGLARICGGALTITTATTRHRSCDILARIGGQALELSGQVLPRYYDPRYRCVMEILRFDSRAPHSKYAPIVGLIESKLADVSVIARPYWPMMRDPRRVPLPAVASHPFGGYITASAAAS